MHTFGYSSKGSEVIWDVKDIWKAVEKLPTEMMDVQHLYSLVKDKEKDFTKDDYERIEEADASYPIIVNGNCTLILDGVHRVFKWVKVGGETAIKRLTKMPTPIEVSGKPFKIEGLVFQWPKTNLGKECFTSKPKTFNW